MTEYPRVFQHQNPVAHPDRQSAAAAPLTRDDADDGDSQGGHAHDRLGDDDPLPALFGFDAGVGADHVDQRDDGPAKLLRLLHQPDRFPVPFLVGQAKVAADVLLGVTPLLRADHRDRPALESAMPPTIAGSSRNVRSPWSSINSSKSSSM